jgi:hypothetical protein
MGIVVKWTPRTDSQSVTKPAPQKAAADTSDVIVFPRVKISELRDLWETMKREIAERRSASAPSSLS